MVGTTWIPSMNTPFDPVATKLAEKSRLVVHIVNGSIDNLKQLLSNKIFVGTTLH
jgi:uridylate kinase